MSGLREVMVERIRDIAGEVLICCARIGFNP